MDGGTDEVIASFLARWQGVTGPERANYQLFLTELAAALDLVALEPASAQPGRPVVIDERPRCARLGTHGAAHSQTYFRFCS